MGTSDYVELTVGIVSAYVSRNSISASVLPELLGQVHSALAGLDKIEPVVAPEPLKPAVPIKKSVTPDYIICLEDGLPFKSLKRHLRTKYDMTPETYRAKWGLPNDYPMVASSYAEARSALALKTGLGRLRRESETPPDITASSATDPATTDE